MDVVGDKAIEKKWLSPEERKTFWIENEYIEAVKGKKEYIFKSGLPHLYLTDPERELKNRSKGRTYEDELAKNVTIDIRQCKEKVSYENAEWIYVKSHYYKGGKTIYNQGWVRVPEETERFSAYNWKKFGFKTYDAEAHRMYPIKGVNSYEGTSEFIKKMIRLIDGQGKDNKKDGKIQNEELQACYNKPELYHTFSRMVCKHKSEWSYSWSKIEEDARAFYKYHYPDAKEKEIKERLDEVKLKYDALYDFWDKLNFKTDTFWYFEPFGWVEQMKRVFSTIDRDKIIIKVNRIKTNNKRTISTLVVDDGVIKGYTLERDGNPPEKEIVEKSMKRIRAGEYNFEITTWSNKEKYINTTLRLLNVPGRKGILLHWGNTEGWSEGCLLGNRNEPLSKFSNDMEKDSKEFVKEIVEYVRKREKEIKEQFQIKKVTKKIIITQDEEQKD